MASRFLTTLPVARGWMPEPLFQLQREIDRVFEDVFSATSGGGGGRGSSTMMMSAPRIDLQDSEGELRLHADLPGVTPSDLDIRVDGDVLTIRGERKSESERNEQNYHVMERSHGRFQRSIQLPFAPDPQQVEATVKEGVLEVRIPKRAPQERSRRIQVRDAGAQGRSIGTSASGSGADGDGSGSDGASGSSASGASGGSAEQGSSSLSSSNFGGTGSSSSGSTQPGSGSASSGAGSTGSSGGTGADRGSSTASGAGATGQGPGGSSSVTPGSDGGPAGGGLAGAVGGPTAVPSGQETSTSR